MRKEKLHMWRGHNRFHDNLIIGLADVSHSRPLDRDDVRSPRVFGRPANIRRIVSLWGRVKAAWEVFTLNAVALRWYDEQNAGRYGNNWYEAMRDHGSTEPRPATRQDAA